MVLSSVHILYFFMFDILLYTTQNSNWLGTCVAHKLNGWMDELTSISRNNDKNSQQNATSIELTYSPYAEFAARLVIC